MNIYTQGDIVEVFLCDRGVPCCLCKNSPSSIYISSFWATLGSRITQTQFFTGFAFCLQSFPVSKVNKGIASEIPSGAQ